MLKVVACDVNVINDARILLQELKETIRKMGQRKILFGKLNKDIERGHPFMIKYLALTKIQVKVGVLYD